MESIEEITKQMRDNPKDVGLATYAKFVILASGQHARLGATEFTKPLGKVIPE